MLNPAEITPTQEALIRGVSVPIALLICIGVRWVVDRAFDKWGPRA